MNKVITCFFPFRLFVISFFLFSFFLVSSDTSADQLPVIEIPSLEHDFGTVNQGLKLTHDFIVKNTGASDLIIRELNPSCGCTAAVLEDPVLKAGAETAIRVSFDTTGFIGTKSKTVRIYSNDPKNSSMVLRVKAHIVPEIFTEPSSLEIFNVKKGDEVSVSFTVKSMNAEPVPFKDVISRSEYIKVSSDIKDSGEVVVMVSLSQSIPPGKLRSRVVVRTNNPRVPVINVPVLIDVVRDLSLDHKSVNFGYVSGSIKEPLRKEFKVHIEKGAPEYLRVVKVSITGTSHVKAYVHEPEDARQIVQVDLLPGAQGVVRGVLLLETNHVDPEHKIIEVPLYAVVDNDKD